MFLKLKILKVLNFHPCNECHLKFEINPFLTGRFFHLAQYNKYLMIFDVD